MKDIRPQSTLVGDIISLAIRPDQRALVFTPEISAGDLLAQVACRMAGTTVEKAKSGSINNERREKIRASGRRIAESPLFIDDTDRYRLFGLMIAARIMHEKHKLNLIMVDHPDANKADVKYGLTHLSKGLDLTIMVYSKQREEYSCVKGEFIRKSYDSSKPTNNQSTGIQPMKTEIEIVTPYKAKEYLARNTRNRNLRKRLVSLYAKEMKAGKWLLTHQGIAFASDGTLLDGQHRLAAIIEAGQDVRMAVTRDMPVENQIAMDDHAKRNASDALSLALGKKVEATDVAIIRAAWTMPIGRDKGTLTKQDFIVLLPVFERALEFASPYTRCVARGIGSAPVWGAIVLAWFYYEDLDRLRYFCDLLTGRKRSANDEDIAAIRFREILMSASLKEGYARREAFFKCQKALKAFEERRKLTKIYAGGLYYNYPLTSEAVR